MRLMHRYAVALGLLGLLVGCSSSTSTPSVDGSNIGATVSPTGGSSDGVDVDVVIERRDFQVTYKLDAVSAISVRLGLMSNRQLSFVASVPVGSAVTQGQTVGTAVVHPDVVAALEVSSLTSSIDDGRLRQLREFESPIVTRVGGVFELVGGFPVVNAPGIDVVAALTPIQDLRYQSLGFTGRAVIETVVGQRDVACEAVWTQQPDIAGGPAEGSKAGGSELHCRLPGFVETAQGLRARVVLESERFENVVVIPNIYIGYDATTDGYFIKVVDAGVESTIPVTVGVTDGVVRVIVSEVPVGAVLVPPRET